MDGKEILVKPALENLATIAKRLPENWYIDPQETFSDLSHLSRKVNEAKELVLAVMQQKECPDKLEPSR